MAKTWDCPKCGKCFHSEKATADHIRDVHGDGPEPRKRKRPPRTERDYGDMSLAEISVEARLKKLMGEPLDPLEESLVDN